MLSAAARRRLPARVFGLRRARKYPMPDRAHAIAAKARALQQFRRGKLSRSSLARIRAMADRVLRRARR